MDKSEYMEHVKAAKHRQAPHSPRTPHCCATCEHLTAVGYCLAMMDYPPLDFIEQENECVEYSQDVPF